MRLRLPGASARTVQRLAHAAARFTRPLTIGVRAVLLDPEGRVFLVRHSYVPGWHLPGGAVEVGETAAEALVREVREECHIVLDGPGALHGIFFNAWPSRRDHVVVYVARGIVQAAPRPPDWEIVESGFFPADALPEDTSPATRARLAEIEAGGPPPPLW